MWTRVYNEIPLHDWIQYFVLESSYLSNPWLQLCLQVAMIRVRGCFLNRINVLSPWNDILHKTGALINNVLCDVRASIEYIGVPLGFRIFFSRRHYMYMNCPEMWFIDSNVLWDCDLWTTRKQHLSNYHTQFSGRAHIKYPMMVDWIGFQCYMT